VVQHSSGEMEVSITGTWQISFGICQCLYLENQSKFPEVMTKNPACVHACTFTW